MRKKNYLKHLAAGLFALTMTVSLAVPVQLSAAFVSGSKPKLNSNPVYITDANGKKTGIKTFSIGPYTYNNLSVDKDITSTPTVELTTETQRKIVSKYLMPQWSAIAAELFQDQADQLVTIKGTGMMSRNVNERNSFDRQFNYKRAGVPQVYNEDDVWAIPDLAAALASKDAFTAGKRMKDYRHYTGLVSISSLKEARRLMGQELRNAADDDDNTVDDFLGNDYDKSKGEYRLPDLQKDTRGGFASVVTSIYTMASNDYDYVTFGLAFYDIDISPIAADGLDYIAAAQDYEKEEYL